MNVSVWVAEDTLWVRQVKEVVEAWAGSADQRTTPGACLFEASVASAVERTLTGVVIHRSLMPKVVRAEVVVRPEMIGELPELFTRAAAGIQSIPELELLQTLGVVDDEEVRVIGMLAGGTTNAAMRSALGISARQLQYGLRRIYALLGASDKTEAAALAARLVRPAPSR